MKPSNRFVILISFILILALLTTGVASAGDEPPPDIVQPEATGQPGGSNPIGQSFTSTGDGEITDIGVVVNDPAGTYTLEVYQGAGNGGTKLYSQSGLTLADNYTGPGDYTGLFQDLTLTSPLGVSDGDVYTFYLVPTSTIRLGASNDTPPPYSGGTAYLGGSPDTTRDLTFSITIVGFSFSNSSNSSRTLPAPKMVPTGLMNGNGEVYPVDIYLGNCGASGMTYSQGTLMASLRSNSTAPKPGGQNFQRTLLDLVFFGSDGAVSQNFNGLLNPYCNLDRQLYNLWQAESLDLVMFDGENWASCNPSWTAFGEFGRLQCLTNSTGTFGLVKR